MSEGANLVGMVGAIRTAAMAYLFSGTVLASPPTRPGSASSTDAGAAAHPSLNLLAPIGPPASAAPARSYELARAKDSSGDLIYEATAFHARIRRDGSVFFKDKHLSALAFIPWWPVQTPTGVPTLESAIRGALASRTIPSPSSARPAASMSLPLTARPGAPTSGLSPFHADPREICVYPRPCFFEAGVLLVEVSGQFDLTDEVLRFAGQDPYRYEKAQFLMGTRELRVRMAARAHGDDLRSAGAETARRLEAIASDPQRTMAERQQLLEALRDEMDVTTPEGAVNRRRIQRLLEERFRSRPEGGPSTARDAGASP